MNNLHALEVREAGGVLNDSVNVGVEILGMPFHLSTTTGIDIVKKWIKWHDKWEKMDRETQDSYLILLALKGDQ